MANYTTDPLVNNTLEPGGFKPAVKKILPFPLENIEEDIADTYFQLDKIRKRIEVTKRNNVTNFSKARLLKLKKMQYKVNTTMALLKDLVKSLDDFWIN
jgi:hypothetical protein